MTDVLIIYPPATFTVSTKNPDRFDHPPMGILYIAAVLEEAGFNVAVSDISNGTITLPHMINEIEIQQPKVILFSTLTSNIRGAVELAKQISEQRVDNHPAIGIGGHHISADPEFLERFPFFDFGITGEGEITIVKLVTQIMDGGETPSGLFVGETPRDLDQIPLPARHLVDFRNYKSHWAHCIVASRGCPFDCVFCSRPAVHKIARFRTPRLIVDEMNELFESTHIRNFMFLDDTINLNHRFLNELCDSIISSSDFKPKWNAQARLDLFNEELAHKMSKAGCHKLMFGVESGNDRIRNQIVNKNISQSQIEQGVKLCRKYRIKCAFFLMLGFPSETQQELMDTVSLPTSLNPGLDEFGVHITIPLPGSKIFETAIQEQKIERDVVDRWIEGQLGNSFNQCWPRYIPDSLTLDDLHKAVAQMYRQFYMRPSFILKTLCSDLKSPKQLRNDARAAWDILTRGDMRAIE
ncbi:MAG: B12-binding domain-containing radical SAM protein [bacterium]|nr:B12-binding domain-containing radical SAM protein [bacterium]